MEQMSFLPSSLLKTHLLALLDWRDEVPTEVHHPPEGNWFIYIVAAHGVYYPLKNHPPFSKLQ